MLTIDSLEVRYGQAIAVGRASLAVAEGSWTALIGPNGAGKTSLLRAIMGLVPHGGRVTVAGRDVSRLPAWERQRLGLGFVPEGRQIFAEMTVAENLRVGGYTSAETDVRRGLERSYALFPRLGERRGQLAATLSGGEQQMLALARALMTEPKLLLVDEISWGLMPILVAQVFAQLAMLNKAGLTILQVEQNTREVLRRAEHAHVMTAGRIVFAGPAATVAQDSRVLESYIG